MIIYFLSVLALSIVNLLMLPIAGLADVSLTSGIAPGIVFAAGSLGLFYQFVPAVLIALGAIMVGMIGFELAIFSYKMVKWIYTKIPGIT